MGNSHLHQYCVLLAFLVSRALPGNKVLERHSDMIQQIAIAVQTYKTCKLETRRLEDHSTDLSDCVLRKCLVFQKADDHPEPLFNRSKI